MPWSISTPPTLASGHIKLTETDWLNCALSILVLLHPAASSQKEGQVLIKLVFDVRDVGKFCREAKKKGLVFGVEHKADGYTFANCKDPSKNSISISSRVYRRSRTVQYSLHIQHNGPATETQSKT